MLNVDLRSSQLTLGKAQTSLACTDFVTENEFCIMKKNKKETVVIEQDGHRMKVQPVHEWCGEIGI